MSTPLLKYIQGTSEIKASFVSSPTVNIIYSNGGSTATLSISGAPAQGQQIYSTTLIMPSDYVPTIIAPTTGTTSTYRLSSLAAVFWTITYQPTQPKSFINLRTCLQCIYNSSTSNSVGLSTFAYTSNALNTLPIGCAGVFLQPPTSPSAQYQAQYSGLVAYQNTTGAQVTFTLGAFAAGSFSSQRIIGANSTATPFGGAIASTAKIIEIFD